MSKINLDVLFKKIQKDDKKEVLEFHILGDEVPHSTELIEMAGGIAVLKINDHDEISAEFKKIQRDSKKAVLHFEVKGDSEEQIIKLYKHAGHNVTLQLEKSQMSIDEFYEVEDNTHEGIPYNVNNDGTVDIEGQVSLDDIPVGEDDDVNWDDDDLLN